MSITAKVYSGTSPGTLIATLSARKAPNWLHQLNEPGSGSVQIHVLDPDLAAQPTITNYYNIIRFAIDGTDLFAIVVENPDLPPVPTEEASGQWWTLSGRGVLALLEDAIVYPEVSLDTPPKVRDRTFGWMSAGFDDSGWSTATQIAVYNAGYSPGLVKPLPWPGDPNAYWIWSQADAGSPPYQPVGTSYFRRSFNLATDEWVGFFATADDCLRVWLDGEIIIDNLGNTVTGFHDTMRADRRLEAGDHQVAIQGVNLDISQWRAAVLLTGVKLNSGSHRVSTPLTIYTHTSNTWKTLGYPAMTPGMTVGQILSTLIDEAQTRGGLPGITLGFSDTLDSNGNAWSVVPDLAFTIGATYLDVVRTLVEQTIDVEMTPTLVLNAYNKGTLGSDKTGTISLLRGTHFEELDGNSFGHVTNAILARIQDETLLERTDATSLAARKRKERYVELATAPSTDTAISIADAVFPDKAYPVIQLSGKVTMASGPETSYAPGDKIKMPNKANVATSTDVISLSFEEDDAGNPIAHIEASQADS